MQSPTLGPTSRPTREDNAVSITWRNKMSIGEPMIDSDHKRLIDLINTYETAIGAGDMDLLKSAFDGLMHYTETHFAREEDLMRAIHYKDYQAHKDAHDNLKLDLRKFHETIMAGDDDMHLTQVNKFLHDWLIDHVLNEDMKLKPILNLPSLRHTDINWR